MVEQDNTHKQSANGAERVVFLPQQNGASCNNEHLERRKKSVDENKPEVAKEKTYIFKARTVYFLGALFFVFVIIIISLAVSLGILLKRSPTNQCPSCAIPCPQGWVVHKAWCYYFSLAEATWNSSRSNCSSQDGSLTTIDTQSEMDFLLKEKEDADYWIGLRREKGQPWKWSNGSDFNSWFRIGADGQCAYLNDRNASSSWCTTKRNWICRRPSYQP